ncbi:MAG: PHA/PHB synthase family protein, partial [Geminicoccaceae bacterium]
MEERDSTTSNQDKRLEVVGQIAERSQKLLTNLVANPKGFGNGKADPLSLAPIMHALMSRLIANPTSLIDSQFSLWQNYIELWQNTSKKLLGHDVEPVIKPEQDDRRFRDAAWDDDAIFDVIKQSYLLTSRWMMQFVDGIDDLDDKTRQKIDFYTRQFVDVMAPSNFVATNPEVLRATLSSGGDNLLRGFNHLLDDLNRGQGKLAIKMTDPDAFEVGVNLATTPGKVVFQNDLMQLIQYEPSTTKVYKQPLLIIPPWINKYYILDLRAKNSFIKFAVDQGLTVFVISWVNPDERYAEKTFEDYMLEGPLAALDAIEQATGETEINAIGYCLGGTLLSSTLAYMAAKRDKRIKATTFFTALTDFENPGDLGVFIDEDQLAAMDEMMAEQGFLDGREMATTFNTLRANDLIWSFVINNYLLGKEPFPFDLLYWNSDSTRMPCAMHSFYLRKFYHENKLVEPGGVTLCGVPIDLKKVRTPTYMLSTKEDHIAPWMSTYAATQLFRGKTTF